MSVYISTVAEGATPGIGHYWLEIRDSLYMTTRRFTLAQQPGQSLDIPFASNGRNVVARVLTIDRAVSKRLPTRSIYPNFTP